MVSGQSQRWHCMGLACGVCSTLVDGKDLASWWWCGFLVVATFKVSSYGLARLEPRLCGVPLIDCSVLRLEVEACGLGKERYERFVRL